MLLNSKKIAFLGVLLGLNQLFLVLSSVIETNTLILMSAAALMIGIVIVEYDFKSSVIFYAASCILGFFITFNKLEILTYILFFGMYSIVKHLIESRVHNKSIEYLIKIIYFNAALAGLYFTVRLFVALKIVWWMVIGLEAAFFIYDFAFTIFINYYIDNIKPKLKK